MDSEELIISPDYHIGQCFACLKCLHCFKLWNAENEEADRCSCPINQKPPTKDTYTRTIEPKMTGMGMAWVRKKDDANDWGSDFTRPFNISLCGRDNSAYQRALKADDNNIPSKRGRKCKDTLQALNNTTRTPTCFLVIPIAARERQSVDTDTSLPQMFSITATNSSRYQSDRSRTKLFKTYNQLRKQ
jgi:hypothetical protein